MRLTKRCWALLKLLRAARWLTTSQIHRRYFRESTMDAARKRLRKLIEAEYLIRFRENRMSEAAFALGREGRRVLGEDVISRVRLGRRPPKQWEHFRGINDVRIAVERLDDVSYFFSCWELQALGWNRSVIPDAVFSIGGRNFVLEYDRGFENTKFFVSTKMAAYRLGLDGLPVTAILVVCDSQLRLDALRRAIGDEQVVYTTITDIREDGLPSPLAGASASIKAEAIVANGPRASSRTGGDPDACGAEAIRRSGTFAMSETLLSRSLVVKRVLAAQVAFYQLLGSVSALALMRGGQDGIRDHRVLEESRQNHSVRRILKSFSSRSPAGYTTQSLSLTHKSMAWRPYENLIDGELDNRVPGKVTGWIRFLRRGQTPLRVELDLKGDFHEDIRGKAFRINNPQPTDRHRLLGRAGSYVERIRRTQRGIVGDITGGFSLGVWSEELLERLLANQERRWALRATSEVEREDLRQTFVAGSRKQIEQGEMCYCHFDYPYIEWYGEKNGRVVLELEPSQLELIEEPTPERPQGRKEPFEMEMIQSRSCWPVWRACLKSASVEGSSRSGPKAPKSSE